MPGRFYGQRGSSSLGRIVDSNKNIVSLVLAGADGVKIITPIAEAQDSATLAVAKDVERGCQIRAIHIEGWCWANELIAEGISNSFHAYIMKNPGSNLTPPVPGTTGTSNEKKFIFKEWKGLIGARTQGVPPYRINQWIKIPPRFRRMGANDVWQFVHESFGTDHLFCLNFIYKWYK